MVLRYPDLLYLGPDDPEFKKSYSYSYSTSRLVPTEEHGGPSTILHDPIHGGIWIQPKGSPLVGTITGLVVTGAGGTPLLLSNRHVFFMHEQGAAGGALVSPPVPPTAQNARIVGYTKAIKTTPKSTIFKINQSPTSAQINAMPTYFDAAVASIVVPYTYSIPGIGVLKGHTEPKVGMKVVLAGGRSGMTHGMITNTNLNWRKTEDEVPGTYRYIKNTFMHSAVSHPGDSGAPVVDEATNKIVGLHFAGDDKRPDLNVACRASAVASAFGISFVGKPGVFTPAGYKPPTPTPNPNPSPSPTPYPTTTTDDLIAYIKANPVVAAIGGLVIVTIILAGTAGR